MRLGILRRSSPNGINQLVEREGAWVSWRNRPTLSWLLAAMRRENGAQGAVVAGSILPRTGVAGGNHPKPSCWFEGGAGTRLLKALPHPSYLSQPRAQSSNAQLSLNLNLGTLPLTECCCWVILTAGFDLNL